MYNVMWGHVEGDDEERTVKQVGVIQTDDLNYALRMFLKQDANETFDIVSMTLDKTR